MQEIVASSRAIREMIQRRTRELREEEGLTQYELHKLSGVSQATISHIETGEMNPHKSTVKKIAAVFGLTYKEFIRGQEAKTP